MDNEWKDKLAGARMQVDQQFNDRVLNSEFTNQQWGLVMTAVEFEIENPENPETAEMVANTEKLDQILPELDKVEQGMGAAGPGGGGGGDSGGGILDTISNLLSGSGGGSGGVDAERRDAATALTGEYATELQKYLEKQGRWVDICESAAASGGPSDG